MTNLNPDLKPGRELRYANRLPGAEEVEESSFYQVATAILEMLLAGGIAVKERYAYQQTMDELLKRAYAAAEQGKNQQIGKDELQ